MTPTSSENNRPLPTPVPPFARMLRRFVDPLYRFFDWLYGSEFNPLYRSGTLAVGFLFILIITGLYLCLFYSVSQPYESIVSIQEQVWLGRWVRTLHRYTTVATVVAILFHVLQLLAQGKCWGPRTLAWVSGVLLTIMYFVSAWSGYVMVWDQHGQRVAMAGAELLAGIPMLRSVVIAAFDGTAEIPPGFFFMNLFLHVAVPLAMIMFLWVHTARLSRAVWFPRRAILWWSTVGLVLLSLVWPAPLLEKANLLRIIGSIPTDISTGFWMPWASYLGVYSTWFALGGGILLLTMVPWFVKPAREDERPISTVDQEACTGCMQCTRDCPYEAIRMVPRSDGKRLIAEIIPPHCVSCGVCAASCADFAIGPPGRTAIDQRERVSKFCDDLRGRETDIVVISCANNPGLQGVLEEHQSRNRNVELYPVECCGCVHSEVLEQVLKVSKGCALIGCPARNCFNRDGGELLAQRIFEKRVPFLDRSIDRDRILVAAYSEAENEEVRTSLEGFHGRLAQEAAPGSPPSDWGRRMRALLASTALLSLCAVAAQAPLGADANLAIVRVAGTLPSSEAERCRTPTSEDTANIPLHMRPKEICERNALRYEVRVSANGREISTHTVGQEGGRVDQPLFLEFDTQILPGKYHIEVLIMTAGELRARCGAEASLNASDIYLAHYLRNEATLVCGRKSE